LKTIACALYANKSWAWTMLDWRKVGVTNYAVKPSYWRLILRNLQGRNMRKQNQPWQGWYLKWKRW